MTPADEPGDDAFADLLSRAVRALPDAPPAWQQAAIALMAAPAARPTLQAAASAALRLVTAVLSFDSWATPALAHGMRSLRGPTRHLLYSAEGRDIDLRIASSSTDRLFTLTGQILGPDETGVVAIEPVGAEPAAPRRTALDELGEFRIDGLAVGAYRLTLEIAGEQIALPPLDIGEPPH